MYLLFLGFVYVLLIAASSSIDTCYYYSYSDYKYNYGFTSSSDLGNYRCSQATNSGSYYKLSSTAGAAATWNSFNTGYCCLCPYGKMVPPSIDTSTANLFKMTGGDSSCIECEMGSYSDKTTQGICLPCPLGTYQDKTGQTSCNKCPSGKTTMTLLLATTWAGSGASTSQTKSIFYGAYSINQCVDIPVGYSIYSLTDNINGYYNQISLSRGLYAACVDKYKVSKTNSSSSCSSCLSGQKFHAGGEAFNSLSVPISSYFSGNFYFYGSYKSYYSYQSFGTTSTLSLYEYLFKIDWSDSQGAKCVDNCPAGFKTSLDLSTGKATNICKKCSEREGEYGNDGSCSICPENKYPKKDGALECSICPWPFLSHIPRNNGQYYSCTGNIGSITFPVFCLCLTQNDITAICLLITAFFSINLFIFFYFGNFSKSLDKVDISIKEKSVSTESLERTNHVKEKKEKQLNKRDVLIGLTCYIFVPFVDNITDLAFLLSNKFVSLTFFSLFGFFFCLPGLYFFKTLIELKAVPKFYILPMPKCLLFDEYNSLYKLIAGTIVLFPFVVINTPVLFPMLLSGNLLYGTKAFSIRPVANLWLHIWTGARFSKPGSDEDKQRQQEIEFANEFPIDEKILNESLFSHFLLETVPLMILQIFNNQFLSSWTELGYFSMAFSIFNAASGLYRIGYYRLVCKIPVEKIPINFEIFGINVFGDKYATELTGADYSKKTTTFWKYEKDPHQGKVAADDNDIDDIDNIDVNDEINSTEKRSLLLEMKKEMKSFNLRLQKVELMLRGKNDYSESSAWTPIPTTAPKDNEMFLESHDEA